MRPFVFLGLFFVHFARVHGGTVSPLAPKSTNEGSDPSMINAHHTLTKSHLPPLASSSSPSLFNDGLKVPSHRWPPTSSSCFVQFGDGYHAPEIPRKASLHWVSSSSAGGHKIASAGYTVWEASRLGTSVRSELDTRFGELLGRKPQETSVLSPAVVYDNGAFSVFSRVSGAHFNLNYTGEHGSVVWGQTLASDTFLAAAPGHQLDFVGSSSMRNSGAEDPRAIFGASGTPLVVFNSQSHPSLPRSMYLEDTVKGSIVPLRVAGMGNGTQKNWSPFWHEGSLHMLYSADPLTVLRCDANSGACECIFSDGPQGCTDLSSSQTSSRLRLSSPLTPLGDSGVFITALHAQILGDSEKGSKQVYGYSGHLAILSTRPWGWISVSSMLTPSYSMETCSETVANAHYPKGIYYPTSTLLVGEGEGLLVASHFADAESTLQQLEWEEPLSKRLEALTTTACLKSEGGSSLFQTSKGAPLPVCRMWATLGSLSENPHLLSSISPLLSRSTVRYLQSQNSSSFNASSTVSPTSSASASTSSTPSGTETPTLSATASPTSPLTSTSTPFFTATAAATLPSSSTATGFSTATPSSYPTSPPMATPFSKATSNSTSSLSMTTSPISTVSGTTFPSPTGRESMVSTAIQSPSAMAATSTQTAPPATGSVDATPTATSSSTTSGLSLASGGGTFTLSSLPDSAFSGTTPNASTITALTAALTSAAASAGCPTCTAKITSITADATGETIYAASRLLREGRQGRLRALGVSGSLTVAYTIFGSSAASVSAVTTSPTFASALVSAISTSYAGVSTAVSGFSATPTGSSSATGTSTSSPSASLTSTVSTSPTPSVSPSNSNTPSDSPTSTPTGSLTPLSISFSPTATPTPSRTPTTTLSLGSSISNTPSNSRTPSHTPTNSPTTSATGTPTSSITATPTPSISGGASPSQTSTVTPTGTLTPTLTGSPTPSRTGTRTPTSALTPGASPSVTPSNSLYPSSSQSNWPSSTSSPSGSKSGTASVSLGVTPSPTPSITPTPSPIVQPMLTVTVFFALPMDTSPYKLGLFLDMVRGWLEVDSSATAWYTMAYSDSAHTAFSGFNFNFLISSYSGSYVTGGGRRALAATLASITDLQGTMDAVLAAKLTDGSLVEAIQSTGIAQSVGFSDTAALANAALAVPAVVMVVPSVSTTATMSPTPTSSGSPTPSLTMGSASTPTPSPLALAAGSGGGIPAATPNTPAIVGGVIGGLAGLVLLGALIKYKAPRSQGLEGADASAAEKAANANFATASAPFYPSVTPGQPNIYDHAGASAILTAGPSTINQVGPSATFRSIASQPLSLK